MVKLSAILEDHTQRALHPEWAAPAVLEDCGLESGLMSEPDMCHSFQPNTGIIVKLPAILERARPGRHRIIKCVIDRVGGEDDRDTCHI